MLSGRMPSRYYNAFPGRDIVMPSQAKIFPSSMFSDAWTTRSIKVSLCVLSARPLQSDARPSIDHIKNNIQLPWWNWFFRKELYTISCLQIWPEFRLHSIANLDPWIVLTLHVNSSPSSSFAVVRTNHRQSGVGSALAMGLGAPF